MRILAPVRFAAIAAFFIFHSTAQSPPAGMPATTAARILEQATWGPNAQSIAELQTKGFDQWFADQVAAPMTTYPNQPMLGSDGMPYRTISGVQVQFFENALSNPDQLRQRVAFALSEIWVVSHVGVVTRAASFPPLLNVFQKDAFAAYPTLMKDVTLNSAMGAYLDMLNNHKATKTSSPNENYGREIMQLFTLGLNNLSLNGATVLDANKNPIPIYSPATVTAISAAFTGWTYAPTAAGATAPNVFDPMVPLETQHDMTQKSLPFTYPNGQTVTITLPVNQTAETDLDGALAALFAHPTLAPFVSTQLIQHLVTSNPSSDYILRVTTVFNDTKGNLQAVVKAILTDPEARAGDSGMGSDPATFGHFREPVLLVENLLRGLNGSVFDSSTVYNYTSNMGQSLLNEPSVFSYFSPQYRVAGGLLGPEFQLDNTQTAVDRANYIYSAIYSGKLDAGTTFDISEFVTAAASAANLKTLISNRFFHGTMSASVQTAIDTALTGLTAASDKAKAALYIALTSSEFQVIH
jgi:uncharacterized protein (DUF1800 family)